MYDACRLLANLSAVASVSTALTGDRTDWRWTASDWFSTDLTDRSWLSVNDARTWGPMHDGWVDRGRIVCPWHGSHFACRSGEVLRGPATAPLPSYHTRIRDGVIEVHGCASASMGLGTGVAE
jgi:Rieske Fe-S protein